MNDIIIEIGDTFVSCTCGGRIRVRSQNENDFTVEHETKMCEMGRTISKGIFQLVNSEVKN